MDHLRQFKPDAVERLLEQHQNRLSVTVCQQIRATVRQGADQLDLPGLNGLCRDLACLPTDILRAV